MLHKNFININYGQWMTQKTVFIISSKLISIHKSKISIRRSEGQSRILEKIHNNLKDKQSSVNHEILNMHTMTNQHYLKVNESFGIEIIKNINYQEDSNTYLNSYTNTLSHISLKHQHGELRTIEKLWLVNPNLRLGITLIEKNNKCVAICFSSDIRIC